MTCEAFHNSRLLSCRNPQGAVPCGHDVRLSLLLSSGLADADVLLRLWAANAEQLVPLQKTITATGARCSTLLRLPTSPGLVWYMFLLRLPDGQSLYYGGESGEGALYPHEPPGYQITVYDPAYAVPRHFREGVLYQVFPDRFRRGGDAAPGIRYHRSLGRSIRLHENWDDQPYYLPEPGQKDYVPNDFFCGDLAGLQQSLPYLQSLGVTCLYLNPVFESASNHRYDTADYRRVDPILGGNTALEELVRAARDAGIRIMLDGVFSHTGADSVYFNKYERYHGPGAYQSAASPYRSWYCFDDCYTHGYRTWWGFPELPEVEESDPSYSDFVMGGPDSLLAYWAQKGVSSWRLDVADELPDSFIARMRVQLKSLDPDGVLLGEVWEDASTKEAYGERRRYVYGHELDSATNYPFRTAVLSFLLGHSDAYAFNHTLQAQREHYPQAFYYAAMNMLSSHDSVRALTALGGAPDRDALPRAEQAGFSLTAEMLLTAKARLILAAALQMAIPGVPCIYYGDEAGVTGMADPFNRATYPWGREDQSLLQAYRAVSRARGSNAALRSGYCRMGALHPDVFAVLRFTFDGHDAFHEAVPAAAALLLCNRADEARRVLFALEDLLEGPDAALGVPLTGLWRDALTDDSFFFAQPVQAFELPPQSVTFLLRD